MAKKNKKKVESYSEDPYPTDPYDIIDQFFMDGVLQDGREDLNRLLEAAFSDDLMVKKHYPSLLIFAFERIDNLINAAIQIYQKEEDNRVDESATDDLVLTRVKDLHRKIKSWEQFPYKLKPREWVYPRLAIKAFFKHQPISHWRGKLHEVLQAAVRNESICETISDRSKLYLDCEHLERLVEAMWVIKVMELQ